MTEIQQRLERCLKAGNLRTADLARWFDRPYPTVRGWLEGNYEPNGGPQDNEEIGRLLGSLEHLIIGRRGFPVPRLSPQERIAHLKRIRKAVK